MRLFILLTWLFILRPFPLWGQVRVGIEHGREVLSGVSRSRPEADGVAAGFRPYRPTWWGLRLEGGWAGVRPVLILRRSVPDLALEGEALTLIQHGPMTTVTGLGVEAIVPLSGAPGGVMWQATVGGLLERWVFRGVPARWRLGPVAGAALVLPVAGRLDLSLGGSVGMLPVSPFEAVDLPEGLEPQRAWRTALRASVSLGL